MAARISPWLQRVAERQALREFTPDDQRVQSVFRRVIDQIIHFFAHCYNDGYRTFFETEREKLQTPSPAPHSKPSKTQSAGSLSRLNPDGSDLPKPRSTSTPCLPSPTSSPPLPSLDPSLSSKEPEKTEDFIVLEDIFENDFASRITYETFKAPVISLSDCNIYEEGEIEEELKTRRTSLYDATPFDDNRCFKDSLVLSIINDPQHKIPNCPLTGAPFTQPFYCVEDGHTYDKQAILDWASTTDRELIGGKGDKPIYGISTLFHPAQDLPQLTLIPHALIFKALSIKLAEPRAARRVIEIGEAGQITDNDFIGNQPKAADAVPQTPPEGVVG